MSAAATLPQKAENHSLPKSNDRKVKFVPMNLGRSFSYDSSSAVSSSINSAAHTGKVKDLDALSPKLRSFFSFNGNHAIQDIDERFPVGSSASGKMKDIAFLSRHSMDESSYDDGSSVSILHNIFSPKFHAQSAKKKGRPKIGQHDHWKQQQHLHSVFSPVSASSTPGNSQYDANASAVSDMSDDFSTIHAILGGDTLDNIKKTVGLDASNHPLSWGNSSDGSNKSSNNVEDHLRYQNSDGELESKVENHHANAYGDQNIDDSTEVMLDMARLMTREGVKTADHHDPNTIVSSAHGINRQPQLIAGSHATQAKTPKKTPKGSPPTSDDEFYSPTSSIKPSDVHPRFILRSTSTNPMTVNMNLFPGGQKTGLPPVWEEEEGKTNYGREHPNDNHASTVMDTDQSTSSIDVKDFRTPKQHGSDWKEEHYDHEEGVEEEFFSPLAQFSGYTPSKKNDAGDSNYIMNTDVSTLTAFDFSNHAKLTHGCEHVAATQSEVRSSTMTPAATTALAESVTTSSPRNPAIVKELQLLAKKPSNISASASPVSLYHSGLPQDASSISFHLHSPNVSNLSPDALTVDFVKSCDCIETLNTILCVLSDDNNVSSHRNNGKRGKQLRYPSLVRLVERQLQRVQKEFPRRSPNEEKQQNQLGGETVRLLPRVAARGKVLRHQDNDGSDKENVDPRQLLHHGRRLAMEEITRDDPLPMQSVNVSHDSKEDSGENLANANQNVSPSLTYGSISLDMNLSESMLFTLDDESHYWKQGTDDVDVNCKEESGKGTRYSVADYTIAAGQSEHKESRLKDEDAILVSYIEMEDKLAATLSSNARLTSEVDSLVKEQKEIKAELSAKLERMTKQLSQQEDAAASENSARREQIAELDKMNHTLRGEIQRLHQQLNVVNQKAEKTSLQLQSEIEDAKMQCSSLSHDKEILNQKLDEIRTRYEKLLLDKENLAPESKSAKKMQNFVESAKLANKALAKALAVSEHDLAEANAAKDKSERECDSLRKHVVSLEDKAAFLSSKRKEMSTELKSSRAYIDKLYADLEMRIYSFQELEDNFKRREIEWKEQERGYSQRIHELEAKIGSDSNHMVSLDAYLSVIKQTRHYKNESMKNQQTIDSLKERLEVVQKSIEGNSVGLSLQKTSNAKKREQQVERVASSSDLTMRALQNIEVPKVPSSNANTEQQSMTKRDTQLGKQLNRVAVVRAAGGRKGLYEQLKRARGVSPNEHDVPTCGGVDDSSPNVPSSGRGSGFVGPRIRFSMWDEGGDADKRGGGCIIEGGGGGGIVIESLSKTSGVF
ncbi:hypothetical protein ACHAW5_004092 [Stephanodiscus triporus]|uniref:Centrosomal protein of 162 kDa n=1 Tax=Stephanodiscus triporus TaxID=2934178 RepID=A0ABD3PWS8_9STRA